MPDPRVRQAAARRGPPERGRVQRGRRPDDDRDRHRGAGRARPLREPGQRPGCEAARPCGAAAPSCRSTPLRPAARRLHAALSRDPARRAAVRRPHRHLRPRLDADVQRHGQALRRLHPRLEQPGARSASRPTRPRSRLRRSRPARDARVGLRRDRGASVYNEVFMWGPEDVHEEGPPPLRNVVAQNQKVPLTPIEEPLQSTPGPSTGPGRDREPAAVHAARHEGEDRLRDEPAGVRLSDGLRRAAARHRSLLGHPLYYMRCLDKLGTNLVMQDEANPGRWAATPAGEEWQPLEWMSSTWRARRRPDVSLRLQRDAAHGRQPRRPRLRRPDRDHPARPQGAGRASGATTSATRASPSTPENDPPRLRGLRRAEARVPRLAPWVRPDGPRDALRAGRRGARARLRATRSRTTTSRRRSSPTCRSRSTNDGQPACAES